MSITAAANEGTDQASRMLNQGLEPRLGARVLVPGGKNPPSCEPAPLPLSPNKEATQTSCSVAG